MTTTEREKERKDWYRSHGLCAAGCGQPLAVNSKWYCADCLQKQADCHHLKYLSLTEDEKKARNEKIKQWRMNKKAAGICAECPKPARPGRVLCVECAIRDSNRRKRRRRLDAEN